MDVLSAVIIGSVIIGTGFAVGLGLQGYFMYKTVLSMSVLKTAPNVESAIRMAKNLRLTKEEKNEVRKSLNTFSADTLPEKALSNIRSKL
jgi:hypothetical protein